MLRVTLAFLLCLVSHFLVDQCHGLSNKSVTIKNGTVIGTQINLNDNLSIFEFLAIPFAQPPIGNLRYARPQSINESWDEPLVANKASDMCMQTPLSWILEYLISDERYYSGVSEDCLYLNIWSPADANENKTKSVMVWIHGGGYFTGSAFPGYNGAALAAYGDVVVVVIQYRLGVFGFLRLDNDTITGNWGLWDQRLALQWVKENIGAFGGDSESITIFGESAGSGSVALHMMSEESRPFFNRAILQSGVPGNVWSYNSYTDLVMGRYKYIAANLSCASGTVNEQLACLRDQTANETLAAANALRQGLREEAQFFPMMDYAFFKKDVLQLLEERHIPEIDIMVGATNDEGGNMITYFIDLFLQSSSSPREDLSFFTGEFINQTIQAAFYFLPSYPNKTTPIASRLLYLSAVSRKDPQNGLFNIRKVADMYGEYLFYCSINRFSDRFVTHNRTVFMYEFAKRPSKSISPEWVKAGHGDELMFVFGHPLVKNDSQPDEKKLAKEMVEDWSEFAKTGQPRSANWKAFSKSKKEFYRLNTPNSSLVNYGLRRDQCNLWDRVLPYVNTLTPLVEPSSTSIPSTTVHTTASPTQEKCPSLTNTGKALIGVFAALVAIEAIVLAYCCYRRRSGKSSVESYAMY